MEIISTELIIEKCEIKLYNLMSLRLWIMW